jgi:hypothetical protein
MAGSGPFVVAPLAGHDRRAEHPARPCQGQLAELCPPVRLGRDTQVLDGVVFAYCHGQRRPRPAITVGDRCYVGRGVDCIVDCGSPSATTA